MELEILYQDDDIVAINKPHGLLVHRSKIANDATEFALQILRDQVKQHLYMVHRLDRKTSGILLFTYTKTAAQSLMTQFQERQIKKTYKAIVRGYIDELGSIDYDLTNDRGKTQEAITDYQCLKRYEIPVPFGKFESSRYSLVELKPQTGRMHQLRKHMSHIFHPIIGDRPHGCNKQNKLWKEKWNMNSMMLHAEHISFKHPQSNDVIQIHADHSSEFERVLKILAKAD